MKLSDYVASFAEKKGIKEAFVLTGGCIVHIIDSIAKKKISNIFQSNMNNQELWLQTAMLE